MIRKLTLAAAFGAGYVLGAKAGTQRYDEIVAGAQKIASKPPVQKATDQAAGAASDAKDKATALASDAAETVKDKVNETTEKAVDAVDKAGDKAADAADEAGEAADKAAEKAPLNGSPSGVQA